MILFLLFAVLVGHVWTRSFDCDDYYGRGAAYCFGDYSGYHVCARKKGGWGRWDHKKVKCPQGTRCTCHWFAECRVKESDICKPFVEMKPFVDPAVFVYTETYFKKYLYSWEKDVKKISHGVIKQDISKGSYMEIERRCDETYFNIILRTKNEKLIDEFGYPQKPYIFYSYSGNIEKKRCWRRRLWIDSLYKYLGKDFKRYSLTESYEDEANQARQKWYYKHMDHESQYYNKFFEGIENEGNFVPTKSIVEFRGHEDHIYESTTTRKYNVSPLLPGYDSQSVFKVPDFC